MLVIYKLPIHSRLQKIYVYLSPSPREAATPSRQHLAAACGPCCGESWDLPWVAVFAWLVRTFRAELEICRDDLLPRPQLQFHSWSSPPHDAGLQFCRIPSTNAQLQIN